MDINDILSQLIPKGNAVMGTKAQVVALGQVLEALDEVPGDTFLELREEHPHKAAGAQPHANFGEIVVRLTGIDMVTASDVVRGRTPLEDVDHAFTRGLVATPTGNVYAIGDTVARGDASHEGDEGMELAHADTVEYLQL